MSTSTKLTFLQLFSQHQSYRELISMNPDLHSFTIPSISSKTKLPKPIPKNALFTPKVCILTRTLFL